MGEKVAVAMMEEYDRLAEEALTLAKEVEKMSATCPLACKGCGVMVLLPAETEEARTKDEKAKADKAERVITGSHCRSPFFGKKTPG